MSRSARLSCCAIAPWRKSARPSTNRARLRAIICWNGMPRARRRIAPACRKCARKWMRPWNVTRGRWMPEKKRPLMPQELSPRRATTLEIADRIAAVNEQELNNGDERLKEIFDRFRYRLGLMLAITLGIGALLAVATTRHILHLARDADLRYRQVTLAQGKLKELS